MAALADDSTNQLIFRIFVVALAIVTVLVAAVTIYVIRRQAKQQEKIARLTNDDPGVESCKDYQVIQYLIRISLMYHLLVSVELVRSLAYIWSII